MNGAGCVVEQRGKGMLGAAIYLFWGEPWWMLFLRGARKLLLAVQHHQHQEAQVMPAARGRCCWVSRASHGCTGSQQGHVEGARELDVCTSCESM